MERLDSSSTVNEIGAKTKSKVRIYIVLVMKGEVYHPHVKDINYSFLRNIIARDTQVSTLFMIMNAVPER